MRRARTSVAAIVVAALTLACGGDGSGAGPDDGGQTPTPADEEDGVHGDDPEAFARADAAQRAGVDASEVSVATNEDVTWPDGSLGCPQPDRFYTQALVEGYRIVVEAGGDEYHYHGQTGQPPAYCENPSEPVGDTGVVDR